jgi:putative membrane protein
MHKYEIEYLAAREVRREMSMALSFIPTADEKRISDAIIRAEKTTSGEIVAVVAAQCDSYTYAPLLWAALIALALPWPFIFFTWWPVQWIYLLQLVVFAALVLIMMMSNWRFRLVPAAIKRQHAHGRAVEQFLVQNLHTTDGRTGVLIFVSVAERYAESLADKGIHAKVPQAKWQEIVDQLTSDIGAGRTADGFVKAIDSVGAVLAKHFPPGSHDHNGLPLI